MNVRIEKLTPLHEMRLLRGTLEQIIQAALTEQSEKLGFQSVRSEKLDFPTEQSEKTGAPAQSGALCQDYVQAVLTDELEPYDPVGRLRSVYPNMMQILRPDRYSEPDADREDDDAEKAAYGTASPLQTYLDFYEEARGEAIDEPRLRIVEELLREAEQKE